MLTCYIKNISLIPKYTGIQKQFNDATNFFGMNYENILKTNIKCVIDI